jgi:carboxylesterase
MTQHPWLDPSSFFFDGGPIGVLLIHGFTGAPPEMRPMGDYLAAQGYTVSGPRLAGHGTRSQDLKHTRWQDWVGSAGVALTQLQARCAGVFVGGLSMGSLIALHLATYHPEIAGLILMAPGLIVANKLTHLAAFLKRKFKQQEDDPGAGSDLTDPQAHERIWCYPVMPLAAAYELIKLQRIVRRKLDRVTQPLLIFQGRCDREVSLKSAPLLYDSVRSGDKELVWLHNSGHCLTVDSEREAVWQKTHQWITQRARR